MRYAWSRYLIALCFLSPLMFTNTQAQTCIGDINMLTPAASSTDVAIDPTITVETNMDLVPGVLANLSPVCGTGTGTCVKPVLLIPADVYNNVAESNWHIYATPVNCTVTATREIELELANGATLRYGTEYALVFRGIEVENTGVPCYDAIDEDFSLAFETIHEPSTLYATSVDDGAGINCSDDILVVFNGRVTSMSTPQGDVIEMQQLVSASNPQITPVSITTTIDADNKTVTVDPVSNLQAGEWYEILVNAEYLTGDPDDNIIVPVNVRSMQKIQYNINSLDPNTVLTQADVPFGLDVEYGVPVGESFTLWSPAKIGNLYLKEWTSNSAAYDLSIGNELNISPACDAVMDLELTANYDILLEDTYRVHHAVGGTVDVINSSQHTPGGSHDDYLFPMDPSGDNPKLILIAKPGAGYSFDYWSCPSEPSIHGFSNPLVEIPGRSPYYNHVNIMTDITPVYKSNKTDCTVAELNIIVHRRGYVDPTVRLEDLVSVPGLPSWTTNEENLLAGQLTAPHTSPPTTISMTFELDITHAQCYSITGYYVPNGPSGGVLYGGSAIGGAFSIDVDYPTQNDCENTVYVYVEQNLYDVSVTYQLNSGGAIPSQQIMGIEKTDYNGTYRMGNTPITGANGEWIGLQYHFKYPCGTIAKFTPVLNNPNGQTLFGYDAWSCVAPYRCNNIVSTNPDVLQFNVTQNEEVLYEFEDNFRITEIGYIHTDEPLVREWKYLYGNINRWENSELPIVAMDRTIGGLSSLNLPSSGPLHRSYPRLHFRFSEEVDESTLENGNIKVEDVNNRGGLFKRPDGKNNQTYNYVIGDNGDKIGTGDEITLDLYNSNEYACHMDDISIVITSQIKSQAGDNLANPFPYGLRTRTEMPGYYAYADEFIIGTGFDDDHCFLGGEPDVIVIGLVSYGEMVGNRLQNVEVSNDLRIPSSGSFRSVHTGEYLNEEMITISKLGNNTQIEHGWVLIDEGNGAINDQFGEIFSNTIDELQDLITNTAGAMNVGTILANATLDVIEALILGCEDALMDEMTVRSMSADQLWGSTALYDIETIEEWSHGNYIGETFKIKYRQALGDVD